MFSALNFHSIERLIEDLIRLNNESYAQSPISMYHFLDALLFGNGSNVNLNIYTMIVSVIHNFGAYYYGLHRFEDLPTAFEIYQKLHIFNGYNMMMFKLINPFKFS
ncbi:unnamed protein product [Rhizophagus irregularis]|nr:unnamed protein product [Rhizophagus irregularis]